MLFHTIQVPGQYQGHLSILPVLYEYAEDGLSTDLTLGETTYSFVALEDVCSFGEIQLNEIFGAMIWTDALLNVKWFRTRAEYELALATAQKESENENEHD